MKHVFVVALGLVLIVLIAGAVTVVAGRATPAGSVYTVAQVQAGLQQHPTAWAGRTVRVHGMAAGAAFGNTYMVYGCGPTPSACTVSVPARTVVHLLLVPDGVDAGATTSGISGGDQTLTYHTSTATAPIPGMVVLVQPHATNALLTALRRVPLVGLLIPNESQKAFQRSGVYWMHIPVKRTCDIAAQLCDDAVLIGAPQ